MRAFTRQGMTKHLLSTALGLETFSVLNGALLGRVSLRIFFDMVVEQHVPLKMIQVSPYGRDHLHQTHLFPAPLCSQTFSVLYGALLGRVSLCILLDMGVEQHASRTETLFPFDQLQLKPRSYLHRT